MNQAKMTVAKYFKNMQRVHFALVTSSLLINFAVAYLVIMQEMQATFVEPIATYLMISAILSIPVSAFLGIKHYNKTMHELNKDTHVPSISKKYKSATIIRLALLEGAAFFNMIFAILLANSYLFLTAALGILYMTTLKPSREKFLKEVEPKKEIANIFENDENSVIE